jgi:hypothetical protein
LQGGGNMPAYGKNLNPPETTALVAFLETLHPSSQAQAKDASLTSAVQPWDAFGLLKTLLSAPLKTRRRNLCNVSAHKGRAESTR